MTTPKTSITNQGEVLFSLNDVVRLRKNDLKVKKVSDALIKSARFAFQQLVSEGTYAAELRSGKHDVIDLCKQEMFRNQYMLLVEGQLALAGYNHYVALLGNQLSLEVKLSRHTLIVFEVCKHFQLIIYELPYINLPAAGLPSSTMIDSVVKDPPKQCANPGEDLKVTS